MTPVRPGGWILVDDSVLLPGAPPRPGFEGHAELEETRRRIERSGAEIVAERSFDVDAGGHDAEVRRIVRCAAALVGRRPELADLVTGYVERQRDECAFLERWTRDVTWLLRKPTSREAPR